MSETYTGPLQNVLVNTTTLKEYVPNIEDYLLTDSGQTDFESFEKVVKRKVYREICKKLGENPLDDGNDLVSKILQYAGISIREGDVFKFGQVEEQTQNQEQ